MNPNSPITLWHIPLWQCFSFCLLIASTLLGLYLRTLRVEREKRREMLQKLHEEGEVEVLRPDLGLLESMDEFAILIMIRGLIREAIISEHTLKVLCANQWKTWQVYQLTDPKGVKLATEMFGSPPKSPPE